MASEELVVLKTYNSAVEADIDKVRLEEAGIPAMVRTDDCGGMRPHLWLRGVDLVVRAADRADAQALLEPDDPR